LRKYLFLFPVLLLLLSLAVQAAKPELEGVFNSKKLNMVWVIIDQVSLSELREGYTPNLDYLQERGAFSLINVRPAAGAVEAESTYLSINAGKRCQGSKKSLKGEVWGKGARNDEIEALIALNQLTEYRGQPGRLGDLARENNIQLGVLGNSDLQDKKIRTIVTMAMDSYGLVPLARIDESILEETREPWGYQSDFQAYLEAFDDLKEEANAIFIETGDISRIEYYFSSGIDIVDVASEDYFLLEKKRREYKLAALEKIDAFIGSLLAKLDLEETQLAILSPTPPREERAYRLGWILLVGREVDQGWLTSTSTRRNGIITIADLLSIFTAANGIEEGAGSRVYYQAGARQLNWPALDNLYQSFVLIYRMRSYYIKTFIFFQIVAILLSLLSLGLKKSRLAGIIATYFTYLLIAILFQPVNCLLISFLELDSENNLFFFLLLLLFLELVLLQRLRDKKILQLYIITTVLVVIVTGDLINNYRLLADSLLGYSSILGARYYGLGNEYMGFYLGAFLLNLGLLLEFWKGKGRGQAIYSLPFFLFIIYTIGSVNLGANFGGLLTAVLAGAVNFYQIIRIEDRFTLKKGPLILTGLILVLAFLLVDYWGVLGKRSHIGLAVEKVLSGDWQWIKDMVFRKLRMNIKLLRWTIWTRVLLAMIAYLIFLLKKPVPILKEFFARYPYIKAAFQAALVSSLLTMLVNDSGVVAAATLLFYPVMSLLYCLTTEKQQAD
jgi:hypothetical protein